MLLLLALLAAAAVAPQSSATTLQGAIAWLTRRYRPISVTVGLVFGAYSLWKGLSGLLT